MMSLKDGFFWILSFGANLGARAVILMYHSIADRPGHFNSVSPAVFREQMDYLKAKGFPVISLETLVSHLEKGELPEGAVVITFDDGYRDNYTEALPVLRENGFPATVFVVTGRIGSNVRGSEYLSHQELMNMQRADIDIEPHTKTHPRLTDVSDSAAREEMVGSRTALEDILGKKKLLFAYPYGNFNDRTVEIARECGFRAAVTVREGTVGLGSDPLKLPRISIDASTSFAQFRGKLSRAVDRYEAIKKVWK